MPHQDRLNIAVFIDFDNIEIGVKNTLGQQFDPGTILDAIKERGEVVTKIAYADWTRAGEYSRALTQHAIRLVQRNLTPGGDKNGADINLALDALEMVFTHQHINAYVIVGGDSDFLSLVEKLKQYDKKVFVVGGRQFTSVILQRNCHEFIAYENLSGVRKSASRSGRPMPPLSSAPLAQAYPIVRRALKILADREVSPQAGLLKSTLLQLDSTFSERNYGASSFFDFVDKLSRAGFVVLRHSGRSLIVELNEGYAGDDGAPAAPAAEPVASGAGPGHDGAGEPPAAEVDVAPAESAPAEIPAPESAPAASFAPRESSASGVERAGRILGGAANARWPMYLRNVKQLLRQSEGGFDERRYGFGGLMDLLKACQREGLVRIERDHRGGLRVFRGPQLRITSEERRVPVLPQEDPEEHVEAVEAVVVEAQPIATAPPVVVDMEEIDETGPPPNAPIPIDHTANRLGRAKPRKPRLRALHPGVTPIVPPPPAPPSRSPRTPAKKAAAATPRKGRRPRKPSSRDDA